MDTTGACATCAPIDFGTIQTSFPEGLNGKFMMAMAYASPLSPEFCVSVQDGICADYAANTCCCEAEVSAWQSCLVEKDFSVSIGQATPCTFTCAGPEESESSVGDGGEGGSMMVIVIVVMLVLAAGGGVGGYLFQRKRRADANGKGKGKGKDRNPFDDDSFKDDKQEQSKTGGFFSRFRKVDGTPPSSDSEDQDKKKNNRSLSSKSNRRDKSIPTDLSLSQDESEDYGNQRSPRQSRNGSKKRYEDEDSIANKYGEDRSYRNADSPRNSRSSSAREKKRDIENQAREAYGNTPNVDNFDDDDISELDNSQVRRNNYSNHRSSSTSDLPSKIQSTRKISSRELKNIMRDRDESSRRLNFMEEEVAAFEVRLARRDREAEDLERERDDQYERIRELEARNARLQDESQNGSRSTGSRHKHDDEGDGYGRSSRSKASLRDGEVSSKSDRRNNGRARSRSNSGRSLGRTGPRRPQSRSPSSTRGLGKQASTMRREASRERLERNSSRSSSSRQKTTRNPRSKSPRSYLREADP